MSAHERLHQWRRKREAAFVRARLAKQTVLDFDEGDHVRLRIDGEPALYGHITQVAGTEILAWFPPGSRRLLPTQLEIL